MLKLAASYYQKVLSLQQKGEFPTDNGRGHSAQVLLRYNQLPKHPEINALLHPHEEVGATNGVRGEEACIAQRFGDPKVRQKSIALRV